MKVLQVCNVGNICGGTAACAWTISHAFPDCKHDVVFLSRPDIATQKAFSHCEILSPARVDETFLKASQADLVLLHNTHTGRIPKLNHTFAVQYHHSAGERIPADLHVACSEWLTQKTQQVDQVLYQPVPLAKMPSGIVNRKLADELTVGRICTPTRKKWPPELLALYRTAAEQFPEVHWEFVGAPPHMQKELHTACQGHARFLPANMEARSHFWRWHAMLYHHPSLTESFGRTVAEAMRTGCVPIVDSRGGFREQVIHRRNGFLCGSESEFLTSIAALTDRENWIGLSQQAKVDADDRFSLETFRANFRKLLLSAL